MSVMNLFVYGEVHASLQSSLDDASHGSPCQAPLGRNAGARFAGVLRLESRFLKGLLFYALVLSVSFLCFPRGGPGCLFLVRFETRDGTVCETVLAVFVRFERTTAPKTWRSRLSLFASGRTTATSTWRSRLSFLLYASGRTTAPST